MTSPQAAVQFGNGMNDVYEPPAGTPAIVNIIFIHGLFGHPWSTWAAKDRSKEARGQSTGCDVFWPRAFLPEEIPNARIYSFGYDADVEKFMSSASLNSVHEHGHSLLDELSNLLDDQKAGDLPLMFVVHSLGGLVLKEALNQSSGSSDARPRRVAARTTGIVFLGTPHRGAKIASLGRVAFRLSEILGRQRANVTLLRALEQNSETIDRITTSFTETVKRDPQIRIMSFYEEKETRISIVGERIVEPASAKLGIGEWDGIPEDHRNMARFASSQDIGFKKVSRVIKRWMRDEEKPASARGEQAQGEPPQHQSSQLPPWEDASSYTVKGGDARGGGIQWGGGRAMVGGGDAGGASVGKAAAKTSGGGRITEAEAEGGRLDSVVARGGAAKGGNVELSWP